MIETLVEILRCPIDNERLTHDGAILRCGNDHTWPLVGGIPRLFEEARLPDDQRKTADAFGYAWMQYPNRNPYTEEQWRDWILPLTEDDFEGARVLDAGCGLCGFAEYARMWGARQVVGIDLSEAVDAARERVGDRVDVVQGDILRMPFPQNLFDIGYSIGVLHHLPDPERGFHALARTVKPGGLVFAWVYGREGNGWIVHLVDPVRKGVTSQLPRPFVKWCVALPLAALLWPVVQLARRVTRMPYGQYLGWLGARDFEFLHGVVFDHLVAPTSYYTRREEFESWFVHAGLVDVKILSRNQNSWRGVGRVPDGGADR